MKTRRVRRAIGSARSAVGSNGPSPAFPALLKFVTQKSGVRNDYEAGRKLGLRQKIQVDRFKRLGVVQEAKWRWFFRSVWALAQGHVMERILDVAAGDERDAQYARAIGITSQDLTNWRAGRALPSRRKLGLILQGGRGGRRRGLVVRLLEKFPGFALEEKKYKQLVSEHTHGGNGVYALYSGNRLYYVGLARDLRSRLKSHLRDQHAQKWDWFSMYLTEGDEHLKDLESLVLRIADPSGNRVKGKLVGAEDLRPHLLRRIKEIQRKELEEFTCPSKTEESPANVEEDMPDAVRRPRSAPGECVSKRLRVQMSYKNKLFSAVIRRNGTMSFTRSSADWPRLKGRVYRTPSAAAKAATGRAVNGWFWWKFRNTAGVLVRLTELRSGNARPCD